MKNFVFQSDRWDSIISWYYVFHSVPVIVIYKHLQTHRHGRPQILHVFKTVYFLEFNHVIFLHFLHLSVKISKLSSKSINILWLIYYIYYILNVQYNDSHSCSMFSRSPFQISARNHLRCPLWKILGKII